jgi:hypothetical protein
MAEMAMPGMMMPSPQDEMTPENLAAFEQMRQDVSPTEFNGELLSAASEADPVAVAEFKAELRDLNLPPEVLDVLNQMVDEILANPGDYAMIRSKYMAQDIPEDLLPPTFDPEFFGALNLAIDEIRATSGMQTPPMGFANGGLASLNPIAAEMARAGRYGDTMLAHISPREASVLRRMGGSGTINPQTGLPEFFLKKLFKGVSKVFKKIGKAVKKFASSTVGKIVTSIALGFFLGPAAASMLGVTSSVGVAAVSGFVGGAGSTLAAGGSLKDALKMGAIGGLTAGAIGGVTQGAAGFEAGSYQGPTTIGGQVDKFKEFVGLGQSGAPASPGIPANVNTAEGITSTPLPDVSLPDASQLSTSAQSFPANVNTAQGITSTPLPSGQPASGSFVPGGDPFAAPYPQTGPASIARAPTAPVTYAEATEGLNTTPLTQTPTLPAQTPSARLYPTDMQELAGASITPSSNFKLPASTPSPSIIDRVTSAPRAIWDKISPKAIAERGSVAARKAANTAYAETLSSTGNKVLAEEAYKTALAENMPNAFAKYGPLAGVGLGVAGLMGGFEGEEAESPLGLADLPTGAELLAANPEKYGINLGPMFTTGSGYGGYGSMPLAQPRRAAHGGPMNNEFPRKNGHIAGPGTGTSDDIPAMLSDGEFVFTAKAVRGMGDGSRRKGAKRMYALMKRLEGQMANG